MKYSQRNLRVALSVALILTLAYVILYCILSMGGVIDLGDAVVIIGTFSYVLMPVPILMSWWMYIERYTYLELNAVGKQDNKSAKIRAYICLAAILYLGIIVWKYIRNVIFFILDHWNYIAEFYDCIALNLIIAILWLFYLIYVLCTRKQICFASDMKPDNVFVYSRILIFLVCLTIAVNVYVEQKVEDVWYEKMVEYSELHEMDDNAPPFTQVW